MLPQTKFSGSSGFTGKLESWETDMLCKDGFLPVLQLNIQQSTAVHEVSIFSASLDEVFINLTESDLKLALVHNQEVA